MNDRRSELFFQNWILSTRVINTLALGSILVVAGSLYAGTNKYEEVDGESAYMIFDTVECRMRLVALLPPPGIIPIPRCGLGKGAVEPIDWLELSQL